MAQMLAGSANCGPLLGPMSCSHGTGSLPAGMEQNLVVFSAMSGGKPGHPNPINPKLHTLHPNP